MILLAAGSSGLIGNLAHAGPTIETTTLAPANAISIRIGPGGHVAAVVRQGSRVVMMVDGKTGPRFDRFLASTGRPMLGRRQFPASLHEARGRDKGDHPVIFSPDGTRYGYVALDGADYVVMVDGKEVHRARHEVGVLPAAGPSSTTVSFSPSGRHYWFVAKADQPASGYLMYMDGKPGAVPLPSSGAFPVFSPDEKHHAYTTHPNPDQARNWRLVVDGKPASYAGSEPRFLPNGKLVTESKEGGAHQILIDGKSVYKGPRPGQLFISPDGRLGAIIDWKVWVDGKFLSGTEGAQRLFFSPDGRRVAAYGGKPGGTGPYWVWVDGVRSDTYSSFQHLGAPNSDGTLTQVAFTADSSKCYAVAFNAGMEFLVVNGRETGDGYQHIDPVVSPQGGRLGFVAAGENRASVCVIDDKKYHSPDWLVGEGSTTPVVASRSLTFSRNGAHSYFFVKNGSLPVHYLDGKTIDLGGLEATGWNSPNTGEPVHIVFSPDGKRMSYVGAERISGGFKYWIFLDGKRIQSHENGTRRSPGFTSDGRHFCWLNIERSETRNGMDTVAYVDGARVIAMNFQDGLAAPISQRNEILHLGDDGKIRLLAVNDDGFVRHTITP